MAWGNWKVKTLDYIIVNDVTDPDAGFGKDTNVVTLLSKNGTHKPFQAMAKKELAKFYCWKQLLKKKVNN